MVDTLSGDAWNKTRKAGAASQSIIMLSTLESLVSHSWAWPWDSVDVDAQAVIAALKQPPSHEVVNTKCFVLGTIFKDNTNLKIAAECSYFSYFFGRIWSQIWG
jgi:hypothetical protein